MSLPVEIHPNKRLYSWVGFGVVIGLAGPGKRFKDISYTVLINYTKLQSSFVVSTLYKVRTDLKAIEFLGDDIRFKHKFPWISGTLNSLNGIVEIKFTVQGSSSV